MEVVDICLISRHYLDMDENDMNNEIVNGKRYESVLFDYYNTKVLKGVLMKIHSLLNIIRRLLRKV